MEHRNAYQDEAAALATIPGKLVFSPDSLRIWVCQAQRDGGERPGPTSEEKACINELERENSKLHQANLQGAADCSPPFIMNGTTWRVIPSGGRACHV